MTRRKALVKGDRSLGMGARATFKGRNYMAISAVWKRQTFARSKTYMSFEVRLSAKREMPKV